MNLALVLLTHGALGYWDEVLCLIPGLALAGLVLYSLRVALKEDASQPEWPNPDDPTPRQGSTDVIADREAGPEPPAQT